MTAFAIGDRVSYAGNWGSFDPKVCTITGIGEKNGRTVYDNDLDRWGYADQYSHDLSRTSIRPVFRP